MTKRCKEKAVLPLIDILPPVFVWYEYNTVTTLAVDPLGWVSAFLIIVALIKLFNHVASLILVFKKNEIKEENILVISFKILVEHKIIDDFFLKAIDFWLVYFYFSRFLVHGTPVSDATYVSIICTFIVKVRKSSTMFRNFSAAF
jgi:hypothetical protein